MVLPSMPGGVSVELHGEDGVGEKDAALLADGAPDGAAALDAFGGALGAGEDLHQARDAPDPSGLAESLLDSLLDELLELAAADGNGIVCRHVVLSF